MSNSSAFYNAKSSTPKLSLSLDIDPKKEIIREFFYDGPSASFYEKEMEELKTLVMGMSLKEARELERAHIHSETRLSGNRKSVTPLGLWLLHEALDVYSGEGQSLKEDRNLICLCFSVTKKEIVESVLKNKDFDLKVLISETKASSACGSCRHSIEKIIVQTRSEHGLIKGLDHSQSRYDKEGKWIQIAGLYPGPLVIKIEELKNEWMKREGIEEQYQIEILSIEGYHLKLKINSDSDKVKNGLINAMTEYLKSRLGVLFFSSMPLTSFF